MAYNDLFTRPNEAEHVWESLRREVQLMKLTRIRYNKAEDKALVEFAKGEGSDHEEKAVMVKAEGKWTLSRDGRKEEGAFDGPAKAPEGDQPEVVLTAAETKEIEGLIAQLGAANPGARKAAYANLRAMVAKAAGLLEKAKDNEDPEIAEQAKRLLEKK
jgi:hypothetical protein